MKWFFQKKKDPTPKTDTQVSFDEESQQVSVKGSKFVSFNGSKSPNGKYLVACMDAILGRGGARNSGHGTFILAEDGNLRLEQCTLERPNDSAVADNGSFVINDWRFSSEPMGTFYAFDKTGDVLIQHAFEANLHNNAISASGCFAICSCISREVALFDLKARKMLWQKIPETGVMPDGYTFDEASGEVSLIYSQGKSYRYNLKGELLDNAKWDQERRINGFLSGFVAEYNQHLQSLDAKDTANRVRFIEELKELLTVNQRDYAPDTAKVYRLIGEIYEALQQTELALEYYRTAFSIDEKSGVKRKITCLEKKGNVR